MTAIFQIKEEHYDAAQTQPYFLLFVQVHRFKIGHHVPVHEFQIWIMEQHRLFKESIKGAQWHKKVGIASLPIYQNEFLSWLRDKHEGVNGEQMILEI